MITRSAGITSSLSSRARESAIVPASEKLLNASSSVSNVLFEQVEVFGGNIRGGQAQWVQESQASVRTHG